MMTVRSIAPTLDRAYTLNRQLDRVLNQALGATNGEGQFWVPATDVVERPDAYLVSIDLPGVSAEQVEISFEKNTLVVRGTRTPSWQLPENGELRVYAAERIAGPFQRTVRLPEHVDGAQIDAAFEQGVLTISVPKLQAAQPRKIAIRAAGVEQKQVESGAES